MKYPLLTISPLSAVFILSVLSVSLLQAQEPPAYRFTFLDGSLSSSGTIRADLAEKGIAGSASSLLVEKDEALGCFVALLPMTDDGERGSGLAITESEQKFRLAESGESMTISCWIKWNGPDRHPDLRQGIITNQPMEMNVGWAFSILEDGKLNFCWVDAKGLGSTRDSSESIRKNEWTNVAVTWANGNEQKGLHFFINGEPAGIGLEYTGGGPMTASDLPLFIGAVNLSNFLPLNGAITDLRLYTSELDPDAIFRIFQDQRIR